MEKLAGGFFRLSGGTADAAGRFYAVDARRQRIYRWTEQDPNPCLIADPPFDPVNLACDATGNLLVVSYSGSVYLIQPDMPEEVRVLNPQPAVARPGATAILPVNFWSNGHALVTGNSAKCPAHFVSPDGSVFVPASEDFLSGRLSWGVKDHDLLRAFGLIPARTGSRVFITLEEAGKTYSATVDEAGSLNSFRLFAERGGEAVATDSDGNVYIAEGQIFVYSPDGNLLEVITVPERPLGLARKAHKGKRK